MDTEQTLLQAIHADPADDMARLALADWLEEEGRLPQAELLRLHLQLRQTTTRPPPMESFARLNVLLESGVEPVVPRLLNSIGMSLLLIPPGEFWMGSPPEEESRFEDEGPVHRARITWPFYLGVFPVTQQEYEHLIGFQPSHFSSNGEGYLHVEGLDTSRFPVDSVNWEQAEAFCKRLSELPAEREAGRRYRLPTEAEWEYACRAGISDSGPFHQGRTLGSHQANFDGREPFGSAPIGPYLRRTCPVDAYPPNAFGLFDLHGNISEWCSDWFDNNYYLESPLEDPPGPVTGERRVLRGGSWNDPGRYCRAAFRYDRLPDEGRRDFGFRVLLEYPT